MSEGDRCTKPGCGGGYVWVTPEGCCCHLAPPCSACMEQPFTCSECREPAEEETMHPGGAKKLEGY